MKVRCIFSFLCIAALASAAAQSREDVRIYLPLVVAVDPMQADFFQKNFAMEIAGAGYTVTESVTEADYSMRLRVTSNATMRSDGTPQPAPPGQDQYVLQIILLRNSDNSQVVSLSYGFNELDEMYNHNLSLVYQTLANVPLNKGGDDKTLVKFMVGKEGERADWWRNKWVYLRISADYPISYYERDPDDPYTGDIPKQVLAMPGATAGIEVQFLDWMSLEANFEARFWDLAGYVFLPGVGAQLKFPIKPSTYFMIEPYAAGVLSTNSADRSLSRYSVGGGVQLGVKGGDSGVIFFDVNYMYPLDEATTPHVVGLSLGYKSGLGNRGAKREENSTWLFNNY
jgi:hypothetical protein